MSEFDERLREAMHRMASPADPVGVAESVRDRVAAGDTGTGPGHGPLLAQPEPVRQRSWWDTVAMAAAVVGVVALGAIGVLWAASDDDGAPVASPSPSVLGSEDPIDPDEEGVTAATNQPSAEPADPDGLPTDDPAAPPSTPSARPSTRSTPTQSATPEPGVTATPSQTPSPSQSPTTPPSPTPDTTPPVFTQAATAAPETILVPSDVATCTGPFEAVVFAGVSDDVGLDSVTATWRGDGSATMTRDPDDLWYAVVGPVEESGRLRVTVTATDTAGNSATSSVVVTVADCLVVATPSVSPSAGTATERR